MNNSLFPMKMNKGCNQVLSALRHIGRLASAQDLHSWFRANDPEEGPALTTVYRALDALLKFGLIQAVDIGDGEKRYEAIEPGEHHHHLICTSCLKSIHLDECFVNAIKDRIENRHGFVAESHVLEIFGLCGGCASQVNAPAKQDQ